MTKNFITINDVSEFLKMHNIEWTGKFFSKSMLTYVDATEKNFFTQSQVYHKIRCKKPKIVEIDFSWFTFKMLGNDYSVEWQNFLLERHRDVYPELLYVWSHYMCKNIEKDNENLIAKASRQKQEKAVKIISIEPFLNSKERASNYISEQTLEKIVKSLKEETI